MIPRWLDDEPRMLLRASSRTVKIARPKNGRRHRPLSGPGSEGHAGRHYAQVRRSDAMSTRGAPLQSESTTLSDPQTFLAKAGQGHSISEYGAGDVVFSQGDQAAEVFFVEQGRVKITVVSGRGKEAVVGILATGHKRN